MAHRGGKRAWTGSSKTCLGRRRGLIFIKESLIRTSKSDLKSGSNFVFEYQVKLFPSWACSRALGETSRMNNFRRSVLIADTVKSEYLLPLCFHSPQADAGNCSYDQK